jgi:acyl-CoA thioester hydrolase
MTAYRHTVQYYETDMMGITHHSNYIRWMEEARVDYMDKLGFPYAEMEAHDVYSPVRSVRCEYKHPSTFGDMIDIDVSVGSFNGVVVSIRYEMTNAETGELVCTAESEHCFLNKSGHFVRLKRDMPEFYAKMEEEAGKNQQKQ